MHQLTTEQNAFIHAYSKAVANCPKGLIYKFFKDRERFQNNYKDTNWPDSVGDAWEMWLYAKEWAEKPKEPCFVDTLLGNPVQTLKTLTIRG